MNNKSQNKGFSSLLHRIETVVRDNSLFYRGDKIIVGVSGGADSLALLHLLHALDWELRLIVAYIDHGLRPEEIKEEKQTIEGYCHDLHIPFISKSINVRGFAKVTLINYLNEKGISFCHDSSNLNRSFIRNRVRLDLLPNLEKEFNPSIRQTILQNMDILAHDENFLDEVSQDAFEKCVPRELVMNGDTASIRLVLLPDPLADFHQAIQRRIIEKCFWLMRIKPGYLQIRSFLHFTQTAENNAEIHLADGVRVNKSRNRIILSRPLRRGQLRGSAPADTLSPQEIPGLGSYTIKELGKILKLSISSNITETVPNKELLFLDFEKITFPLLLRPPNPGERFRPYNAPGKKKILRYLGEKKIDAKERASYPVLVSDTRVIALPGLQISHEVRVTERTKDILTVELANDVC